MATAQLAFGQLNLSAYAPGFDSEVARRWGRHPIPGQKGQLLEDIGDGSLGTNVTCVFHDRDKYAELMDALTKKPRDYLTNPRRGTRYSAITRIKESVRWTQRGEVTIVDLSFEDAALSTPDQFKGGPAAQAQQVRAQAAAAAAASAVQTARLNARRVEAAVLRLRARMEQAARLVEEVTAAGNDYAAAALAAWSSGIFDPGLSVKLRGIPVAVEAACVALRLTGPAHEVQAACVALELFLAACNGVDAAIRASSPIPIETTVSAPGGQSLYAFVQQHYARTGKTPSQMREICRTILAWNRNLRRPSLIAFGDVVVRPAA